MQKIEGKNKVEKDNKNSGLKIVGENYYMEKNWDEKLLIKTRR